MQFGQLHHIEYYVNDLSRSNEFWVWFLPEFGYRTLEQWDTGISWVHCTGTYIVFVQVEQNHLAFKNNRQAAGLNHIAFTGKSTDHLQTLSEKLKQRKIAVTKVDEKHLCFIDPNGFAIEVFLQ